MQENENTSDILIRSIVYTGKLVLVKLLEGLEELESGGLH